MTIIDLIEPLSRAPASASDLARLVALSVSSATDTEAEVIVQPYSGQDRALVRVSVRGRPIVRLMPVCDSALACGEIAVEAALLQAQIDFAGGLLS